MAKPIMHRWATTTSALTPWCPTRLVAQIQMGPSSDPNTYHAPLATTASAFSPWCPTKSVAQMRMVPSSDPDA